MTGEDSACPDRIQDRAEAKPFAHGRAGGVPSAPPPMRLQGFPGSAIVAGAGLFLALTALLAASRAPEDLPSFRLRVEVPDSLLIASGVAFTLAVAIVFAMALLRDRRREEALRRQDERPRLPWWLRILLRVLPLLPLVATLIVFSLGWQYVETSLLAWSRLMMAAGTDPLGGAETPVLSLPWLGWLVGLVALLAGLATLTMTLLLLFAERIARWWERRERAAVAEPLGEAVQDGLDDLASAPDARSAIIRCYRRFERVAARASVPRAPWQTPDEFMRETLRRLAIPRPAVDRLTRLFELARFSRHPLGSPERDAARACLEEIRSTLEREDAPVGLA
jgi:Domain of unknown function (DUF4129)